MKSLDEIMSGAGADASSSEEPIREQGNPPEQVETPANEPPVDPVSDTDPQPDDGGMVPHAALHAAREQGKKRYTEAVSEFDRRLKESDERWEKRFTEMMGALRPQQPAQPQLEPQKAQDYWDDPDKFIQHRLQEAMAPMQQAMMANARMAAEAVHKPETVKEAEEAFNSLVSSGRMDPRLAEQINGSPNPFHAAVQWHQHVKRQQSMAQYGEDPEAFIKAEVERRIAAMGGQPAQQLSPQTPSQPMPGSFAASPSAGGRSAAQWSGPKPLSEIMGGR